MKIQLATQMPHFNSIETKMMNYFQEAGLIYTLHQLKPHALTGINYHQDDY